MAKKIIHLVYVPFTGVGIKGYSGFEWYKYRINVFRDYTLKSLANQTDKNFVLWLSFRPEEEYNPLTKQLAGIVQEYNISYIMTFNSLMYHDDKFSKGLFNKLLNIARVVRKCWRDSDWSGFIGSIKDVLYNDKNKALPKRLEKSLNTLKPYFEDCEVVMLTRLDSDDMFHRKAFDFIHTREVRYKRAVVGSRLGLFYNASTKQFAQYRPTTNPPVHTIMFPADIFFNADKHMEYMTGFTSHEDVPKLFETVELPDYYYCIYTDNSKNRISTYWNHPFKGELIRTSYKLKEDFGFHD